MDGTQLLYQDFRTCYCVSQENRYKNKNLLGRHEFAKSEQSSFVAGLAIGILGQVWYLIISIPDLCTLTYFDLAGVAYLLIINWKS